ncbi:MAG TPA: PilZ domain-containing protein [Nitrospira sp.]|nr:PilZ domain-containing protein [Nitrospira sp.]
MASRSNKRRDLRTPLSCPVYYSDGEFHASGMTENLTNRGGCLRGTHLVSVGMKLVLLLIPTARRALIIKKATVRWTDEAHFGVELNEADCGTVGELESGSHSQQGAPSTMTH